MNSYPRNSFVWYYILILVGYSLMTIGIHLETFDLIWPFLGYMFIILPGIFLICLSFIPLAFITRNYRGRKDFYSSNTLTSILIFVYLFHILSFAILTIGSTLQGILHVSLVFTIYTYLLIPGFVLVPISLIVIILFHIMFSTLYRKNLKATNSL